MFLHINIKGAIKIIKLKLIGSDSKNGIKILKNLKKVERDLNYSFEIDKINSNDKKRYNVNVIPTLIINNQVISKGNVLTERELSKVIKPILETV